MDYVTYGIVLAVGVGEVITFIIGIRQFARLSVLEQITILPGLAGSIINMYGLIAHKKWGYLVLATTVIFTVYIFAFSFRHMRIQREQ